jgi:hypothetical protein
MNRPGFVPAAFFIASVVASVGAPKLAGATCATSTKSSPQECCDATYAVQHLVCSITQGGVEWEVVGSQTLCECGDDQVVVETYAPGQSSCAC